MKYIRGILAIVVGLMVGGAVNMGIIQFGSDLIPAPEGVDVTDLEQIRENQHLFQPKHYLIPFLAHAVGTLVGAILASVIASSRRRLAAGLIGMIFLAGGVSMAFMIPAPIWFLVVDLGVAYFPMAWAGAVIGERMRKG